MRNLGLQSTWLCTCAAGLESDSSLSYMFDVGVTVCLHGAFVPIYATVNEDRKVLIKFSLASEGHMIVRDLI